MPPARHPAVRGRSSAGRGRRRRSGARAEARGRRRPRHRRRSSGSVGRQARTAPRCDAPTRRSAGLRRRGPPTHPPTPRSASRRRCSEQVEHGRAPSAAATDFRSHAQFGAAAPGTGRPGRSRSVAARRSARPSSICHGSPVSGPLQPRSRLERQRGVAPCTRIRRAPIAARMRPRRRSARPESLEAHALADVEQLVVVHGPMIAGPPAGTASRSHAHQVYLGAGSAIKGCLSDARIPASAARGDMCPG